MSDHEQIKFLLPWYINGSLQEFELARVERHLRACADCRQDVESERELFSLFQRCETKPESVSKDLSQFQSLFLENRGNQFRRPIKSKSLPAPGRFHSWLRMAVAASVLITAGAVVMHERQSPAPDTDTSFRTLSSGDVSKTEQTVTEDILVVFSRELSSTQISSLADSLNLELVPEKVDDRIYRARPRATAVDPIDPTSIVLTLRDSPGVVFAERALPGE